MNILQLEDQVKGLPDDRLMQEAQTPTGGIPQFLLISEVQRRTDMRKRYAQQQAQQPEGTVSEQILNQGMALPSGQGTAPSPSPLPPQPPSAMPPQQGMAGGGLVQMAGGGSFPQAVLQGQSYVDPDRPWEHDIYGDAARERAAAMERGEVLTIAQIADNIKTGGLGGWNSSLPDNTIDATTQAQGAKVPQGVMALTESDPGYQGYDAGGFKGFLGDYGRSVVDVLDDATKNYDIPDTPSIISSAIANDDIDPQVQDDGGVAVQGTGSGNKGLYAALAQLSADPEVDMSGYPQAPRYDDLVAQQKASGVDTTELAKRARKDAWSNALMQLGAGIASNKFGEGLRNAGIATAQGTQDARRLELLGKTSQNQAENQARALELQGRTSEYTSQLNKMKMKSKETDAAFNRASQILGHQIDLKRLDSWADKNLNDQQRNQYDTTKLLIDALSEKASTLSNSPEEIEMAKRQLNELIYKLSSQYSTSWDKLKGTK